MNIYPAIDLKDGQVVRLTQGKADQKTVYFDDPSVPAQQWKEAGTEWIHAVDLDGAFTGTPGNLDAVRKIIAAGTKVQLGGGMRTLENVESALDAGVTRVVIGTKAVEDKAFLKSLVNHFGDAIAIGIDAKNGKVAVKGWVDTTETEAIALAQEASEMGVKTLIYTDISRDGMLTGPNFEAQLEMLRSASINLIASGGVSSNTDVEHFMEIGKDYPNLDGVIIGKALYDGHIDLPRLVAKFK